MYNSTFLSKGLADSPSGQYLISEYSIYPSSSPAKRGYNDSEDDEDSDESLNSFTAYPNPFKSEITFDVG